MDGRLYMLQPSFAAGEISPDVASRIDLDKYQSALLQAENVFIRPYGSAYRRPGTEHMADIAGGNVRLKEFAVDADESYLLVFRENYIYVYKDDVLKATISSPFTENELHKLRFAQSADVMFITSGTHPVQVLTRHGDTSWTMADFIPERKRDTDGQWRRVLYRAGGKLGAAQPANAVTDGITERNRGQRIYHGRAGRLEDHIARYMDRQLQRGIFLR